MTDQTPEARLLTALDAAVRAVNRGGWDEEGGRWCRVTWGNTYIEIDADMNRFASTLREAILAADPTLICPDPAAHEVANFTGAIIKAVKEANDD